jgi:hypothetical protein
LRRSWKERKKERKKDRKIAEIFFPIIRGGWGLQQKADKFFTLSDHVKMRSVLADLLRNKGLP